MVYIVPSPRERKKREKIDKRKSVKKAPIVLTASVIGLCPTLSKLVRLGGAKVLVKLSVPGRLTYLDDSRAGACCLGAVWTLLLSSICSFSFLTLWETARYRLEYCLKVPLNPNQSTGTRSLTSTITLLDHPDWRKV